MGIKAGAAETGGKKVEIDRAIVHVAVRSWRFSISHSAWRRRRQQRFSTPWRWLLAEWSRVPAVYHAEWQRAKGGRAR
jgi:hypothetical protein